MTIKGTKEKVIRKENQEYAIFNGVKLKNWKQLLCILIILVSLLLTSCDYYLNVLVLPKGKGGSYFIAKGYYRDWTGEGGSIILYDKDNNIIATCEGSRILVQTSVSCAGKEYYAKLECSNGRTVDFNFTKQSCTKSYGSAVDDTGQEYEIHVGISDELMKSKIAEYEGSKD